MHANLEFDLIINGGGLAGASLALDLSLSGFQIALVDIRSTQGSQLTASNNRAIALTYSSGVIFKKLGLWSRLSDEAVTAIRDIEVTDSSLRGLTQLRASDVGFDELGWNIEAWKIQDELYRLIHESKNVQIFDSSELKELEFTDDCVSCKVVSTDGASSQSLKGKVLVIADGGESSISNKCGFTGQYKDYKSSALVCRVEIDRPNRYIAYEHFTSTGPLALLPSGESGYSVVWTLDCSESERLSLVSPQQFLNEIQEVFGDRVGQFVELTGERRVFPLKFSVLRKFVGLRVVVVGNATHTLHPVGGQGFNLALRETSELAEILTRYRDRGWDIGCFDVLDEYQSRRKRESQAVAGFTDGLIRIFANDFPVESRLRNLGLDVVQAVKPIKKFLLTRTMGMHRLSSSDTDRRVFKEKSI